MKTSVEISDNNSKPNFVMNTKILQTLSCAFILLSSSVVKYDNKFPLQFFGTHYKLDYITFIIKAL